MWEFYSLRRRVASEAKSNPAHFALAKFETALQDRLFVCTQNVDDLREQAGFELTSPTLSSPSQEPFIKPPCFLLQ